MKKNKEFTKKDFRNELLKIMPGYKWTVRRQLFDDGKYMEAIGIQSSGFNRTSTLLVIRRQKDDSHVEYEVKSSGTGTRTPWSGTNTDYTLARALRGLQSGYEYKAMMLRGDAMDLQAGRNKDKTLRDATPNMYAVMQEIDEYLSSNPKNYIGSGSVLHRKVQEVIKNKT
jgi:hypothetical protein